MKQKAFLLYSDNQAIIECLTDAEAGKVFKAIYQYEASEGNSAPGDLCEKTNLVFQMFKVNLDRSRAKYSEVCKKRADAGRKGGLAKASKAKQTLANLTNKNKNKNISYKRGIIDA